MWACDTNTASMGNSTGAGVRSMRPRSISTARPCHRSCTSNAGSPVCPFNSRVRRLVFVMRGSALDHLEHLGHRLRHHLLHDLLERLLVVFQLLDELREDHEV